MSDYTRFLVAYVTVVGLTLAAVGLFALTSWLIHSALTWWFDRVTAFWKRHGVDI